jgi:hypothetical protein
VARHDLPLAAFLSGDLDEQAARVVDEHLLACDECWQAVQDDRAGRAAASRLREPVDPTLADRLRKAIISHPPPRRSLASRVPRRWAIWALGVAVVLGLGAVLALQPWAGPAPGPDEAALDHVVAMASGLPTTVGNAGEAPAAVGDPVDVEMVGDHATVTTYRFRGRMMLVAITDRPFPMPEDPHAMTGSMMPWTEQRGAVTLYCPHATVLLAGPVPAADLAALAGELHLG